MGREDHAGAAVYPRELLHGNGIAEHVQSRPAVFRGIGHTHQAQCSHLAYDLVREAVLFVQKKRHRLHLGFGKGSHLGPKFLVLLCCLEIHISASFGH